MPERHFSAGAVRASLIHFLVGRSLAMVLGFGLVLVLVRVLPLQAYAAYVVLLSVLEVAQLVSSVGLTLAAQRYLPELLSKGSVQQVRRWALGLAAGRLITLVFAAVTFAAFAPSVSTWLGFPALTEALQLYGAIIVLEGSARFLEVCLDSMLQQRSSQISGLVRTSLRLGGAVIAVMWLPAGTFSLMQWLLIDLVAAAVGLLVSAALLIRFLRGLQLQHAEASAVSLSRERLARYLIPAYAAQVLYTLWGGDAIRLLAARLATPTLLAPFAFAMQINVMLQRYMPVLLLMNMLRPLFVVARGRDDYRERLPLLAGMLIKLNWFTLAPLVAFLSVLSEPAAAWLTGGRLPEAGVYLLALTGMLVLQGVRLTLGLVSQSLEIGWATLLGTAAGLIGVAVGWVLAQQIGLLGLVVGLVLSELLFIVCLSASIRSRGVPVGVDVRGTLGIAASAVAAAAAAAALASAAGSIPEPALVLVGLAVAVLIYLAVARLLRPFTQRERDIINALIRRPLFVW